ncbi:hypothetical protein CEXT_768761 [Caerostris extrusa]|uniref:Uncharacterized protein n=1 Tax=Caerostris extrusa TaxID=172846 RepID=A0AAV4PYF1_CAEEX|nr:hypothetical protein CEXT_768761 [Caerostris extrusa]
MTDGHVFIGWDKSRVVSPVRQDRVVNVLRENRLGTSVEVVMWRTAMSGFQVVVCAFASLGRSLLDDYIVHVLCKWLNNIKDSYRSL